MPILDHQSYYDALMSKRAWAWCRSRGVSLGGTVLSADLGGSSNYSNENFEGRSGEGFHENSIWSWVTRS